MGSTLLLGGGGGGGGGGAPCLALPRASRMLRPALVGNIKTLFDIPFLCVVIHDYIYVCKIANHLNVYHLVLY